MLLSMILKVLIVVIAIACFIRFYYSQVRHRFSTVIKGKVYRSGTIPPHRIERFMKKHGIQTVIDLRTPTKDHPLNPGTQAEIDEEHEVLTRLGLTHINIPSQQRPRKESIDRFLKVLDAPDLKWPILIHCYHGRGRASLFTAFYLMEYEGWGNDHARRSLRIVITPGSTFSKKGSKGKIISRYQKRSLKQEVSAVDGK